MLADAEAHRVAWDRLREKPLFTRNPHHNYLRHEAALDYLFTDAFPGWNAILRALKCSREYTFHGRYSTSGSTIWTPMQLEGLGTRKCMVRIVALLLMLKKPGSWRS
jgi:hypothetical protein